MGNTRWTDDQQRVIDARNCNLLVSAAAGSGKTAVLVERIIKLITDEKNDVDIDRLLVVTFTNAAAVVTNNGTYIYDLKTKKPIGPNTNPQDGELLKAYLQVVDRDFKK